jgi:hypothetical protein
VVELVKIYVEGGGPQELLVPSVGRRLVVGGFRAILREGFHQFFQEVCATAEAGGKRVDFVPSGGRGEAYRDFMRERTATDGCICMLMVDSERPVTEGRSAKEHLSDAGPGNDEWDLDGVDEDCCLLMVQAMEAWFVADVDGLRKYYGPHLGAIPITGGAEQMSKATLRVRLEAATRRVGKKYHKAQHAPHLLKCVDPRTVRDECPHCTRAFVILAARIGADDLVQRYSTSEVTPTQS